MPCHETQAADMLLHSKILMHDGMCKIDGVLHPRKHFAPGDLFLRSVKGGAHLRLFCYLQDESIYQCTFQEYLQRAGMGDLPATQEFVSLLQESLYVMWWEVRGASGSLQSLSRAWACRLSATMARPLKGL